MVWPADGDSYSHTDLAANFDTLDDIIGQPSDGSAWPPDLGLDGGIYKLLQILSLERAPIGTVISFFRPSLSVPIPTGWHAADGSVIVEADHDFPGISGSVTLPDLRNATVLGADATTTLGTAAAAAGSGNIDSEAGAPGGNATGGSNQTVQSVSQMPSHDHDGVTGGTGFDNEAVTAFNGGGQSVNVLLGSVIDNEQGTHHHTVDSEGGGNPMDNRQRWVGLVQIVKLKYTTTI